MDIPRDISVVRRPLVTRKPYATDDVWNRHRSVVTRLYRDEKKPLKQVKQIMERDYSLYATERMFKTRVRSWGLDKKLKESEVLHILQLKQEREAKGKKSEFLIRNQEVDWEKLMRYMDRRPDLHHKLYSFARTSTDAPIDIICRTPSPALDTSSLLGGPPEIRLPEEMLRIFKGYFEGGLESHWTIQEDEIHCFDQAFSQLHVVKLRTDMDNAITLLSTNRPEAAFRALNNSLDSLGPSIKEQDPLLFYIMSYRSLQLGPRTADSVVAFVHEMHAVMLGHQHPLTLVWSKFRRLSLEHRPGVLGMMAGISVQLLEGRLGILNKVVALALGSTSNILYSPGETDGSPFNKLLLKYSLAIEACIARKDYQGSCECLLVVAGIHSWGQEYDRAKDALARAHTLIRDSKRGSGSPWLQLELSYYEIMARLYHQTGLVDQALEYGYRAYNHSEEHFRSQRFLSQRAIRNLIDLCRQTGRGKEAERWCNILLARMTENGGK